MVEAAQATNVAEVAQAAAASETAQIVAVENDRAVKISGLVAQLNAALNSGNASAAEVRGKLLGVDTTLDTAVALIAGALASTGDAKFAAENALISDQLRELKPNADELKIIVDGGTKLPQEVIPPPLPATASVVTDGTNVVAGATGTGGQDVLAAAMTAQIPTEQGAATIAGGIAGAALPQPPVVPPVVGDTTTVINNLNLAAANAEAPKTTGVKIGPGMTPAAREMAASAGVSLLPEGATGRPL